MTFNIETVGVIGAGQMGAGIAEVAAQAGMIVSLTDVAEERVNAALATINGHLSRQVAKGQMGEQERKAILDKDPKADVPRLLSVDNEMVVPINKIVRVQTIGAEVIHSFAVPSFGIRIDAVPGRLNETWFKAEKTGMYYGQCSQLCGKDHAFMPIAVKVVTDEEYAKWLTDAKKQFSSARDQNYASAADGAAH